MRNLYVNYDVFSTSEINPLRRSGYNKLMMEDQKQPLRSIQPVVTVFSIHDQPSDFTYWQAQSYSVRLSTLEDIRSQYSIHSPAGGYIALSPDYREFIQSLNNNHVRYLVVGGYAVAIHGHPRFTKDMDIWIDLSPQNAEQMVMALEQFGFTSLGLKSADFQVKDQIIQLGYPPNRIDIITSLPGVEFNDCYETRLRIEVDGLNIDFIDLENLRKNKKATGRHQDLADLEKME